MTSDTATVLYDLPHDVGEPIPPPEGDTGVHFDGARWWNTIDNTPPWPYRRDRELHYPRIWFVTFGTGTTVGIPGALTKREAVRNASNHVGDPAGAYAWISDAVVALDFFRPWIHQPVSSGWTACGRLVDEGWVWLPYPGRLVWPARACAECFPRPCR